MIPPDIIVTQLRPDLFLIDAARKIAVIFELTCPWDSNIQRSHDFKEQRYAALVQDLSRDFVVFQFSVEISARGQVCKANRARLKSFAYKCCSNSRGLTKILIERSSKVALLCSYSIFGARKEPSWLVTNPLIAR